MASKCETCGREITMQFTGGYCCWPTRKPTDEERIASLTAEVERLTAENKNLRSSLEMTLETYNKTVHAGLDMMLRKDHPHAQ